MSDSQRDELTVEGGGLTARIAPQRGGRVTSIRSGEREWLIPDRSDDAALSGGTGDVFVRPGMGGWDECFPTVAACTVKVGDRSLTVADHGHLWNRPWKVEAHTPDRVSLSVVDPVFGFIFLRTLSAFGAGLRFEYEVSFPNNGVSYLEGDVPWLWSLNPQFLAEDQTVVRLPRSAGGQLVGSRGERVELGDGALLCELAAGEGRRAFLPADRRTDHATLRHPGGAGLVMRWDPSQLPYLGLWWGRGEAADQLSIGIGPTTGLGDHLDRAYEMGRCGVLGPGQELSWWLELERG